MTSMTGSEWLNRYGVEFDWSAIGYHVDPDGWEHQRFTLKLENRQTGDSLNIPWRQGTGVDSTPTGDNTLHAVRSDIESGGQTWEEFADEFGYDALEAPLSEFRTWEACVAMRDDVARFCGGDDSDMFGDFLRIEEAGW